MAKLGRRVCRETLGRPAREDLLESGALQDLRGHWESWETQESGASQDLMDRLVPRVMLGT